MKVNKLEEIIIISDLHIGLYTKDLKWIKWIKKKDLSKYKLLGYKILNNESEEK